MNNADMPAMPNIESTDCTGETYQNNTFTGLTKREAFAMAAMQGIAGNEYCGSHWSKDTAEAAVCLADALLEVLDNE